MKNNFGYASTLHYEYRPDSTNIAQQIIWLNKFKADLQGGRPVIYAGYRGSSPLNIISGHSYILTGYNSANYFCVNWGYGYDYKTWVTLDAMIVDGVNYKYYQQAIFGIEPAPICSYQKPSTQQVWETNLVELYHNAKTIQNKTYNNNSRGIIYSDTEIRLTGNVHIQQDANVHIAIKDMHCNNREDNSDNDTDSDNANKKKSKSQNNNPQISISAKPITDFITISFKATTNNKICAIQIHDIYGRLIYENSNYPLISGNNEITINTSSYPSGLYITSIRISHETQTIKFIKQ